MAYLLSLPTIHRISQELHQHGESVVLTHGTFDLFHPGHAHLLKESKRLGDCLIVGVESDARVSSYKSMQRPIIPLHQRIHILLENASVDFVFSIDEPRFDASYYADMYKRLSPQFVTYGQKFAAKDKVDIEKRLLLNTEFYEVPVRKGITTSTTAIIDKILHHSG